MKFQTRVFWFVFLLGAIQVSAQGFAGFSYLTTDSLATSKVTQIDLKGMFENYITANFPDEFPKEGDVHAYLLIPENGCEYCIGHTLRFYRDRKNEYAGLRLIVGGHPIDPSYGFAKGELLIDPQKAYKSYGFDGAFPTLAVVRNREVISIMFPESQTIDAQLMQLVTFLEKE
jgi:hypothetical protein